MKNMDNVKNLGIRALVIDAANREVREIRLSSNESEQLSQAQEIVGGYIESAVRLPNEDTIFVNDEGLLTEPEHFFLVAGYPKPLAGNGIIMGADPETGETANVKTSLETLAKNVSFASVHELLELGATVPEPEVLFFDSWEEMQAHQNRVARQYEKTGNSRVWTD